MHCNPDQEEPVAKDQMKINAIYRREEKRKEEKQSEEKRSEVKRESV